jgi:hypothetical protein
MPIPISRAAPLQKEPNRIFLPLGITGPLVDVVLILGRSASDFSTLVLPPMIDL